MSVWVVTFYSGHIIEPECFEDKPVFGSEFALLEVFQRVGLKKEVTVFINKPAGYKFTKWNITWRSEADWNTLIENPPDHIVISRYICSMCELIMPSTSKIWLWVHDIYPHPAYQGHQVTPCFTNNMARRLSGIITVGDSQRDEIILPRYKLEKSIFKTIKNGINHAELPNRKRAPMSFVYSSAPNRGMYQLLKMWPRIINEWPYATLQIFHNLSEQDIQAIQNSGLEHISAVGRVSQKTLFQKLEYIDYWLYPCTFFETCCTTAIEMAYHGPICISNDLGALKENNNGIIIKAQNMDEFENAAFEVIKALEANPTKKDEIRKSQYEWAKQQTWDDRAEDWLELLS